MIAFLCAIAALACTSPSEGPWQAFPEHGSSDLPTDGHVLVWFWQPPERFEVRLYDRDGVEVETTQERDELALRLVPIEPLEPEADYIAEVWGDGWDAPWMAWEFTTGLEVARPLTAAPALGLIDDVYISDGQSAACEPEMLHHLQLMVEGTEGYRQGYRTMHFVRMQDGEEAGILMSMDAEDGDIGVWVEVDRHEEVCVAVFLEDAVGTRSALSETVCSLDLPSDGGRGSDETGCSTAGGLASGWLALLGGVVMRRRRMPGAA